MSSGDLAHLDKDLAGNWQQLKTTALRRDQDHLKNECRIRNSIPTETPAEANKEEESEDQGAIQTIIKRFKNANPVLERRC